MVPRLLLLVMATTAMGMATAMGMGMVMDTILIIPTNKAKNNNHLQELKLSYILTPIILSDSTVVPNERSNYKKQTNSKEYTFVVFPYAFFDVYQSIRQSCHS